MSRDHQLLLDDIRESCEKILRYTDKLTFERSEKVNNKV